MSYPPNPLPGVPTSLKVTLPNAKLVFGQSVQLASVSKDAHGMVVAPTKQFALRSSNPSLATVNANGLVTAITSADPNVLNAGGTVRISVSCPFANRSAESMSAEVELVVLATTSAPQYHPVNPMQRSQ